MHNWPSKYELGRIFLHFPHSSLKDRHYASDNFASWPDEGQLRGRILIAR